MENQKKRFTEEEKNFLLLMIEKFQHVVENKETDGATIHQKRKAWTEIQQRFNGEPDHNERTIAQLQKCWDNIKTKRKKELTASKRAKLSTGGGPSIITKGDDDEPIDSVILNATNVEMEDCIDSDAVMLVSSGSETNPHYQLTDNVLVEISSPVPAHTEQPIASTIACGGEDSRNYDWNVPSEERSFGSRKRKLCTARQAAITSELEVRLKKVTRTTEAEKEVHGIRMQEAQVRLQIALEDLKEAEIRAETARLQQQFVREKHEYEMRALKGSS